MEQSEESLHAYLDTLPKSNPFSPQKAKEDAQATTYDFQYGSLRPELFPYKTWGLCMNQILFSEAGKDITKYSGENRDWSLRAELHRYLYHSRGILCDTEQIVITSGLQHTLEQICRLLPPASVVGMEEPGYDGARDVFGRNGFQIAPLHVCSEQQFFRDLELVSPKVLYVTPSHQFPTGKVMSISMRYRLLKWAAQQDTWIIEDDYDSEYRYHTRPIPSLQSIDRANRVIYIGSFSKALAPGLRIGYMVLPKYLLAWYEQVSRDLYPTVDTFSQKVLALFMQQGHWEHHVRRMRREYCLTHDALVAALVHNFQDKIQIWGANAGQHLLVEIPNRMSQKQLIASAQENGARVYTTEPFYWEKENAPSSLLLLGYSGFNAEQVEKGAAENVNLWIYKGLSSGCS